MLPKSLDGVLDWPRSRLQMHLRTQTRKSAAVCRVRSHLIQHLHRVMANEQFCHVQTPCITSVDLDQKHAFEVIPAQNDTYFEVPVFLNQTAQLHLETVVSGIPRVYTINQAFTAHRHLSKLNAVENLNFDIVKTGSSFDEMLDSAENLCREVIEQVKQSEDSEFALILDQNDNPNFTKILHQNQPYFRLVSLDFLLFRRFDLPSVLIPFFFFFHIVFNQNEIFGSDRSSQSKATSDREW